MPDYKFWMSHSLYKDKFNEAYEKARAIDPPEEKDRINFQCDIARNMYASEPEDVKEAIALENAESHSAKFAAFKKLLSGKFMLEGVNDLNEEDKKL